MQQTILLEVIFQFFAKFRSRLSSELSKSGLSAAPMHMKLLKMISKIPDCTAQEISRELNRDKAQINRAIQEIESKGYIYKKKNTKDKRSHLLFITATGKQALFLMSQIEVRIIKQMSEGIQENDMEDFIIIMRKLRDNL